MMRNVLMAVLLAATPLAAAAAPAVPVAQALADPARGADAKSDTQRQLAALLKLAALDSGDHVLDLIPGNGYFSKVFSALVGPQGRVYAIWPVPYAAEAQSNVRDLAALARTPRYANIKVLVQPADRLGAPTPLDLVFTSQNYHDYPDKFMGSLDPAVFNTAAFRALKPGGRLIIVDHSARAGSGMTATDMLHRIDEATVIRQVKAAGFRLEASSNVLRNAGDDRTKTVFDPAIRGKTDQFVLVFRKPAR